MSDKYQRVRAYLDRRERAQGTYVEMIHCFDGDDEDPGFPLLQSDLRALLADLDAERLECMAQAKLNGIGAERELALMAERDALKADLDAAVGALNGVIDAMWLVDSHSVQFDGTVMFGHGYDFSGIDGTDRLEFLAEHECVVWPSGGANRKWSAYCTYEGSMWFEKFSTAQEAQEVCMRLLDRVMPTHPAMIARATLSQIKAAGRCQA
jgi:hypothetical protein